MKARAYTLLAASVAAVAGMLTAGASASAAPAAAPVLHCNSGYFCAYIHANYDGLLLKSSSGRGTSVSVAGGTSSGANNTSNYWEGINKRGPINDGIFTWSPGTEANLGKAQNDKINFFKVK